MRLTWGRLVLWMGLGIASWLIVLWAGLQILRKLGVDGG